MMVAVLHGRIYLTRRLRNANASAIHFDKQELGAAGMFVPLKISRVGGYGTCSR